MEMGMELTSDELKVLEILKKLVKRFCTSAFSKTGIENPYWERSNITGCWNWKRYNNGRYGVAYDFRNKKRRPAHRFIYEILKGDLPKTLTIDHLCRNGLCVNPNHLEPVTMEVNNIRGNSPSSINAKKTHCIRGHEFNDENVCIVKRKLRKNVSRICRKCKNYYITMKHFSVES